MQNSRSAPDTLSDPGIVARGVADQHAKAPACAPYDHVRVLTGELAPMLREQAAFFAASAVRTPFQSHAWASAFRAAESSDDYVPVEAIAYIDGEPVVMLPLLACSVLGFRYLTWQAHSPSDYCAPLVAPHFLSRFEASDATALLRTVARQLGNIDLIYLPKMQDRLGSVANPLVTSDSWRYYAGSHAISIEGDWESFYGGIRSQRTRHTLKRKAKSLQKMGQVAFVITHDPAQVASVAQDCMAMKAVQLARDGNSNFFADRRMNDALLRAMQALCPHGAWAASIELDGRSIAASFGMIEADTWLLYQFAISDGPESKNSPGQLLLVHLLEESVGRGVKLLDLALGDEVYKFDWCNTHSQIKTTAIALTPVGHLAKLSLRMREQARIWLAHHPSVRKVAKRIKPILVRAGVKA